MNRDRVAAQRNQLARIVILALSGMLGVGGLCLTAWGAKAREVGRGWRVKAAAAPITAAPAAAIVVTKTADTDGTCQSGVNCSLREAIKAANAQAGDDTINFAAGVTGTINLGGPLPDLSTNIEINGPGANLLTVRRNTGGNYRIFNISGGMTVKISGLTISNGISPGNDGDDTDGGGIFNLGALTLSYCSISDSYAPFGGGIFNKGAMTISNSTISGNTAERYGGGILNDFFSSPTLTITNSTISGNQTFLYEGGGIYGSGTLRITNSTISGNTAGSRNTAGVGGGAA